MTRGGEVRASPSELVAAVVGFPPSWSAARAAGVPRDAIVAWLQRLALPLALVEGRGGGSSASAIGGGTGGADACWWGAPPGEGPIGWPGEEMDDARPRRGTVAARRRAQMVAAGGYSGGQGGGYSGGSGVSVGAGRCGSGGGNGVRRSQSAPASGRQRTPFDRIRDPSDVPTAFESGALLCVLVERLRGPSTHLEAAHALPDRLSGVVVDNPRTLASRVANFDAALGALREGGPLPRGSADG